MTRHAKRIEDQSLKNRCFEHSNEILLELESQRIPCFGVHGSLEIFPKDLSIEGVAFPALNEKSRLGHAWVVAPPFLIVDASLGANDFEPRIQRLLPSIVLDQVYLTTEPNLKSLVSPVFEASMSEELSLETLNKLLNQNLEAFWQCFPPFVIALPEVSLVYTPTHVFLSK